jgi:hypothetical protein
MNRDAEAIKHLLAWLSEDPDPDTMKLAEMETSEGVSSAPSSGLDEQSSNHLDPLDSEEIGPSFQSLSESSYRSFEQTSFELGDIPVVQDRFHALLKRRLQTEIEQNPPLFPWESEITDYAPETEPAMPVLAIAGFWEEQLKRLNVPVAMPEGVLATILEKCQAVAQSSLREGAKLVQAVEDLFPGEGHTLNQLAGMVLTPPARSGSSTLMNQPGLPGSYEAATQPQQMALSLLAAREIMGLLTLHVADDQPIATRQWLTQAGTLTLSVEYQAELGQLRVQGQVPSAGTLSLQGQSSQAIAQRSHQGRLGAELFDVVPGQSYALSITLTGLDQPLSFVIQLS